MLAAKSSGATLRYYPAAARATNSRVLNLGEMTDALPDLTPYGELTADRLTRDVTLLQRKKGHRFSSDDVITAYVAFHAAPTAATVLDLGCGIGSVLLHLAWSLPQAIMVGIEAQAVSFALLQHNVARNQLAARVTTWHGDLRDEALRSHINGTFDLVTGTPPYFPPEAALDAMDEQRAFARIEYRGGVEAYIAAGARYLAPHGTLVVCGDARTDDRVAAAAALAALCVVARTDVIAHAPKPPLFSVWTLRHADAAVANGCIVSSLTLRDADASVAPDAARLKAFSGF
ncbi:MAG: methyltransferase [Myxococcales bacterium]|nr:methyltransferase [Myxococcales bacterium]